ncbi:hypothetical protein [Streptomyces sp. NPDC059564]|uniref:hypothetical protein n=1 Tax=Streptomyces sp. NPDC059564 TaxID=3346865 RepID=UPI0036883A9E
MDDGEDVSQILADGRAHVLAEHPGAEVARLLDIEPGRPSGGWTTHPGSAASWFNASWDADF